jgi:hypothetical protein
MSAARLSARAVRFLPAQRMALMRLAASGRIVFLLRLSHMPLMKTADAQSASIGWNAFEEGTNEPYLTKEDQNMARAHPHFLAKVGAVAAEFRRSLGILTEQEARLAYLGEARDRVDLERRMQALDSPRRPRFAQHGSNWSFSA